LKLLTTVINESVYFVAKPTLLHTRLVQVSTSKLFFFVTDAAAK